MSLYLKHVNLSTGKAIAILDIHGNVAETAIVFAEESNDSDGTTAGQFKFLHSIEKGTEPGTWTD